MWYTNLIFWCFVKHIASVFFIQNSFVPDEYWQSLEVAHRLTFGYGYLTWEWTEGIRSYLYPALIAVLYRILYFLHLDSAQLLVLVPRLFQAVLSTVGDYYFVKWYHETTRCRPAWAWFSIMSAWFWTFCATRTLTNTVETVLTVMGLYLYPWKKVCNDLVVPEMEKKKEPIKSLSFLWFVGLACAIRPTAALLWMPLCLVHVMLSKEKLYTILREYIPLIVYFVAQTTLLDSFISERLVFTWWNFLYWNVFQGASEHYGISSWHWYFSSGLPIVLGLHFHPFLMACYRLRLQAILSVNMLLFITILWNLFTLSVLPHKELRFLLPLLPMCLYMSTTRLSLWSRTASYFKLIVTTCLFAFVSIGSIVALELLHNGGITVMPILAKISAANPDNTSLLFLMPCHTTPLYSHLHVNVTARFLTCNPNLTHSQYYVDEADIFYNDPLKWLNEEYPTNGTDLPSHIVLFNAIVPRVYPFLNAHQYKSVHEVFNTVFADEMIGTLIVVYMRDMLT